MSSTRIVKRVDYQEFRDFIDKYHNDIKVNPHAYFRISEAQRKVYKDGYLIATLVSEEPRLIGLQQNGRYAAFFSRKEEYLRIVFSVDHPKNIEIIANLIHYWTFVRFAQ